MLTAGGLAMSGVLQLRLLELHVRGICSAAFNRKSPSPIHNCSAPPSAGLPTVCCHTSPVRTPPGDRMLSGVRKLSGLGMPSGLWAPSGLGTPSCLWTPSGVRRLSGGGGDGTGAAGWYSSLSDSAPVHLCEHFLVSVQQVSGLPWWLSIVVATLSVRTLVTLPLAAYQMVVITKVEALQAEISQLAKRLRYEVLVRARERRWTENQIR